MNNTIRIFLAVLTCAALYPQTPAPSRRVDQAFLDELALACRILAKQGVVDAYGHVTMRSPANPNHFFMSRNLPPALATGADLVEYDLDSQPVAPNAPPGFTERYIHGEIYRARPDVMSVVHFHAPEVIPYGVTNTPLRPIFHMAGFLGEGIPVFDIRDGAGATNMLISNPELGKALARALANKPAALMRGHGAVVAAASLHVAVGQAYYMTANARIQAEAMRMSNNIKYLSDEEARKAGAQDGFERSWVLWKSESALK